MFYKACIYIESKVWLKVYSLDTHSPLSTFNCADKLIFAELEICCSKEEHMAQQRGTYPQ